MHKTPHRNSNQKNYLPANLAIFFHSLFFHQHFFWNIRREKKIDLFGQRLDKKWMNSLRLNFDDDRWAVFFFFGLPVQRRILVECLMSGFQCDQIFVFFLKFFFWSFFVMRNSCCCGNFLNWAKIYRIGSGLPTRGTKTFLWSYFRSETLGHFSQDISRIFPLFSQGRPTCGSNKTRKNILRIIGNFGHFPPGFLADSGPKKSRHFSSERKTRERQKKIDYFRWMQSTEQFLVDLPWITCEALTGSVKTQTSERRKFSWIFWIFLGFCWKFWKEFQSLQGGQIFNFKFFDGNCMKSFINFFFRSLDHSMSHFRTFFHLLGQGRSTKSIKPFLDNFLEILSFESAAMQKSMIDSERQFWTAPNPNPARVLIRSHYLFWSLDPQTVSCENQSKPRKDCVAGSLFSFFLWCNGSSKIKISEVLCKKFPLTFKKWRENCGLIEWVRENFPDFQLRICEAVLLSVFKRKIQFEITFRCSKAEMQNFSMFPNWGFLE